MSLTVELDDRIAKCNKILEQNPNSQIFAALAEAYRKKGELDKAFRACQNGLRIHDKYGPAHLVMAKINFDKGLFDWAEIELQKSIELDGSSQTAELLLAEITLHQGDNARAIKILNRMQAVDPNNPQLAKLLQIAQKSTIQNWERIEPSQTPSRIPVATDRSKPKSTGGISTTELIEQIETIPGVEGVLLINNEGLVAESRWEEPSPADLYGAIACDMARSIQSQLEKCHLGQFESIFIEAEGIIVNLVALRGKLLLIKTNSRLNLGTLRLKLSALLSRLSDEFGTAGGTS